MARLPRLVVPHHLHHLVARGHSAQPIVHDDADCEAFLRWLRESARAAQVALHAYVLLPSRLHLLATPAGDNGLSRMMQAIGRHYVPYFNARHGRSGALWEGRFRVTVLDADAYFVPCAHLIEYQPVLDALADAPAAYRWSSHAHHVGTSRENWLTDHPAYWALGNTPFEREAVYRQLSEAAPMPASREAIESATHKGWALGSEDFRRRLAKLTERRLVAAKPGRPKKTSTDVISRRKTPDEAPVAPGRPRTRRAKSEAGS